MKTMGVRDSRPMISFNHPLVARFEIFVMRLADYHSAISSLIAEFCIAEDLAGEVLPIGYPCNLIAELIVNTLSSRGG
jgi:hypothetical protein